MDTQRNRKLATHDTGFTLIELLVVISIIALLVSILLPALGSARGTAIVISCQSRIRSVGQATHMYLTDNSEYYPYGRDAGIPHYYELTFNPYMGLGDHYNDVFNAKPWHCPVIADETFGSQGFTSRGVYTPNPNIMGTILNGNYWFDVAGNLNFTAGGSPFVHVKEADIQESPSQNATWMDAIDPNFTWYTGNNVKGGFGGQGQQATPHMAIGFMEFDANAWSNDNVASNGLGTAAFRDGHAEALKATDWVGSDVGFVNESFNRY
jgi:prepilin-type N-terminal cleavage/methylation domain-containing protein